MTQDTRKDRRVKIVSLNVRYKSATVDEFIENHAHDVSRGGIYIKTANPFPSGTLLKFEIRLASDQTVITGVGRVVWQRDTAHGTSDRPSGMGVKFIKVDDTSKAIIDRLVTTKTDAGKAYESEPDATIPQQTSRESAARQPLAAPKAPVPGPVANAPTRKATSIGLGTPGSGGPPAFGAARPVPPAATAAPPATAPASRPPIATPIMFPQAISDALQPPKPEQTVMKQAAELLEEALREVGGSVDDIGTNPLFSGTPGTARASSPPRPRPSARPNADKAAEAPSNEARATAVEPGSEKGPAATARGMVAALAPAPGVTAASRAVASPRAVAAVAASPARKKGSGSVVVLAVLIFAVAAVVIYRDKIFDTGAASSAPTPVAPTESLTASAAPPASAGVQTPPSPPPAASASASVDTQGGAAPQVGARSLAQSASASAAPAASAIPAAGSVSAMKTPPAAAPLPPIERPVPVRPPPPAPTVASPAPEASATPAARAPAPRRAPSKPTKPSDDNPY